MTIAQILFQIKSPIDPVTQAFMFAKQLNEKLIKTIQNFMSKKTIKHKQKVTQIFNKTFQFDFDAINAKKELPAQSTRCDMKYPHV